MRKLFLFILSVIYLLLSVNSYSTGTYNINKGWYFGNEIKNKNTLKEVNIPHVWSEDNIKQGKYFKELTIPKEWAGKSIYIKFNGVSSIANLFINNRFVGEHKGSYTAFVFDITPFVKYGTKNFIALDVSNYTNFDTMPLKNNHFSYGGITRDIELIVVDSEHISRSNYGSNGIYVKQGLVTDKMAKIDIVIDVVGMIGDTINVCAEIFEKDNLIEKKSARTVVLYDLMGEAIIPFEIKNPNLWQGKNNPFLYTLKVSIENNKKEITDTETVRFGLRNASIDYNEGFFLNNKKYPLYGVTVNLDRFMTGSGISRHDIEQDFNAILELGATAVRTTPGPLNQYFYDLCDQHGIIVWCDFPFISDKEHSGRGFVNTFRFIANAKMQMNEMLHQYNNHPSIIMYGIFNNISTKGDNPTSFIDDLNNMVKTFSPDRYTVATSIEDGNINFITDLIGWGQYFGWENGSLHDFDIWVNSFNDNWIELRPAISDFGAEAIINHSAYDSTLYKKGAVSTPEKGQNIFHETYINTLKKENRFWGYFVNSMFDKKIYSEKGNNIATYKNYGLITFDRSTKKDAYYLYKAIWNKTDKFTYIANSRTSFNAGANNIITVYSNCNEVELIVNNNKLGVKKCVNGVAEWDHIKLNKKENTLTAIGDKRNKNSVTINIDNYIN